MSRNLAASVELGLIVRSGDIYEATPETLAAAKTSTDDLIRHVRTRIFAPELNSAPWPSQVGARDLTNSLSWFLMLPENKAPYAMESGRVSVKALQEVDFGPRQQTAPGSRADDDDDSGWPIANGERWTAFKRWACSLGFAWIDPSGRLIPDQLSPREWCMSGR